MATLKQLVDETTSIKNELVTCHTNLKSNLENKGVEVTPSDKLLSLIGKVNNLSDIKIKTGDELPLEVENNTIFIQKVKTLSKVYIQGTLPRLTENDVYIQSSLDSSKGTKLIVGNGKSSATIYVSTVYQMVDGNLTLKNAWVGVDGSWKQISFELYEVFSELNCNLGSDKVGNWDKYEVNNAGATTTIDILSSPKRITAKSSASGSNNEKHCRYYIKETLDLTLFNKLYFNIKEINVLRSSVAVGVLSTSSNRSPVATKVYKSSQSNVLAEIDVSQVNEVCHIFIKVGLGEEGQYIEAPHSNITVDKIYLTS